MVVLLLVFKRISILFSIVTAPIYIPAHSVWGFPFLSHPFQYLLFVEFLIIAIPTGVRYLIVALNCTSLIISDVEHIFICLLSIYMSFFDIFRPSAHFLLVCLFSWYWIVGSIFFVFWILTPFLSHHLQLFSPIQ